MRVTQKEIYLFFLFVFLSVMVLAAPVPVDSHINTNNTTEDSVPNKDINGTSVTIPSDFLRRTESGKVFLDFGGNEGDDLDDMFKRKPRPCFDGESLWSGNLDSLEKKISDLLDYIELLLNIPERELIPNQLSSAVDDLETLNKERLRLKVEKQKAIMDIVLGNSTIENDWRHTRHPGYQEELYPAYHNTPYVVPGIVETPIATGGGAKGNYQTTPDQSLSTTSSASPVTGGTCKNPTKGSPGGNDSNPPQKPGRDDESSMEVNRLKRITVEKEITVDGESYTLETELTGNDVELYCSICRDLISPEAKQCQKCGVFICASDYKKLQETGQLCPHSRCSLNLFQSANLRFRINNLQWPCPKNCGSTYDLVNMAAHIKNCDEGERYQEYQCENSACNYTGSYSEVLAHEETCDFAAMQCRHEGCQDHPFRKDLEEHEQTCIWQPVNLGPVSIPSWQKNLIDQFCCKLPEYNTPEQIPEHSRAHFCVSLLVQQLVQFSPSSVYTCRWNCGYQTNSVSAVENHYSTDCPLVKVPCPFCRRYRARNNLHTHMEACDDRPVTCSYGCGTEGLVARDLSEARHFETCSMVPISCEYCNQSVPRKHSEDHRAECPSRPVTCNACLADLLLGELDTHTQQCPMFQPFNLEEESLLLTRQQNAFGPVYETTAGSNNEVYIIIPARTLVDAINNESSEPLPKRMTLVWNQCRYTFRFSYNPYYSLVILFLAPLDSPDTITPAYIDVLSRDGSSLARMKSYIHKSEFISINSPSNSGIASIYDVIKILRYKGDYFIIRIKKRDS